MKNIEDTNTIIRVIKIVLALLMFLCLFKWPYSYYMFVRFVSLIGLCALALNSYENGRKYEMLVFIALALLFQPFFKVVLGRTLWNIVDVVVGAYLLFSMYLFNSNEKH